MPASLTYVQDDTPGWTRVRRGKGFSYVSATGRAIRDAAQLDRIRRLAIPPAYTQVWICPSARGHLQATGRDARGRKQYRYHAEWQAKREQQKFDRMREFGRTLPRIRRAVTRDLRSRELTLDTVVAAIVRLLDRTALRVGNEEYATENGSFGLTTLRNRHVRTHAARLEIRFRGKSGVEQTARLTDPATARTVQRCQELPGQHLFQYIDDAGKRRPVRSQHVNDYLRRVSGHDFTAKDFRTWHASVLALELTAGLDPSAPAGPAPARATVVEVVRQVAWQIGNTQAVCRRFYIHPAVLETILNGPAEKDKETSGSTERELLRLLSRRRKKPPAATAAAA
jgi:DNA topoisomerase-1